MQTERLILRRYCPSDLEDLFAILSEPEVVKFEPYKPMSMDEVRENLAWRISTDEMIAIELKESHRLIGNVYLGKRDYATLEIGYVLNRDDWGQGYAVESCEALIQKAFEQGIHRIYAECDPENTIMRIKTITKAFKLIPVALLLVCLTSCGMQVFPFNFGGRITVDVYENAEQYDAGDFTYSAADVDAVEIS